MKIEKYEFPKSSFLSVEKDMSIIVDHLFRNQNLTKLLLYPTKDCLLHAAPTEEEIISLFGNQLKLVPKINVDEKLMNYLLIRFKSFTPNYTNPEFRNNLIEFDIICHFSNWQLNDYQLRPYRIAAELDTMFDNKHLTGIGETKFFSADQMLLNDEYAGLCLQYQAIHGTEDKKPAANPNDQEMLDVNFDIWRNNKYNG